MSDNPQDQQTLLFSLARRNPMASGEAQPGAGHSVSVSPFPDDGLDSRTPAPGDYPAPNSIAGRVLAVVPTGTHGAQFGTLVGWLPGIYWQKVSTALRELVAAGLVEEMRSNTRQYAGVSDPRFTVRYRINAHG